MRAPGFVASVIVCEEDEVTLELLCGRLAFDRFQPLPARTAEEALSLCRRRPDLLVVDLELPEGSGPELLRRIREAHWLQREIDPCLPVIALRPRAGGPGGDQDLDLAADDYLEKPFAYTTCVPASRRSFADATAASTSSR